MSDKVVRYELKVDYPNGKRGRREFATREEADERAKELCEVHKCNVEVSKIEREYLYSLFDAYDYANDCWKERGDNE